MSKVIAKSKETKQAKQTKFVLIAAGSIFSSVMKAVDLKRNCTISAMFHGLFSGNVNFVTGMKKLDTAHFDTVLRQFIPIKWNKEREVWEFSSTKVPKIVEALGYTQEEYALESHKYRSNTDKDYRDSVLQDFYQRCMNYYNAKVDEKLDKDLSNDEIQANAIKRISSSIRSALDKGCTPEQVGTALLDSGLSFDSLRHLLKMADEKAKVTESNTAKADELKKVA